MNPSGRRKIWQVSGASSVGTMFEWCDLYIFRCRAIIIALAIGVGCVNANAHLPQGSAVPQSVQPSAAATTSVNAAWRSEADRANARVQHGQWTSADLSDPARRARAAIDAGIPNAVTTTAMVPAGVPALLAAEALLDQGQCVAALQVLTDLPGASAASLRAAAFEALGQLDEAAMAAAESVRDLADGKAIAVADLVMVAQAMQVLARVRAADAAACDAIMKTLADARELDRLDWRGRVAEARFLIEKHNAEEAVAALREALALNPRAADAWQLLGKVALMGFDFDGAERAAQQIQLAADTVDGIEPCAPAALLRAEAACFRFDADEALAILAPIRTAFPALPEAIALEASAYGLKYDFDAMRAALAVADARAPMSGRAHWQAGRFLALARQYADAAVLLGEAAKREPNWSVPRNELGLLQMQAGNDAEALAALTEAARLDPYDKRVAFSKYLLEEMAGWKVFTSAHFRVRCRAGVDEILAASMPAQLEVMYREVCDHYRHEPKAITTIELMPDHKHFAVRVTGMPQIHTVAASTGPVIALEPPRDGASSKSLGRFDWLDTIRHEFVHTVTLDRTSNRIPHWFTEAAAVDMEHRARDWETYQLLARTLQKDELFDLDGIKWAFVRPKKKQDRALAYAQGHWMVQFMRESYGKGAVVNLLDHYARGETEVKAFTAVLGISREQFMSEFKAWATAQVAQWGLAAVPSIESIIEGARSKDDPEAPLSEATIAALLVAHSTHPDVLELAARRSVARSSALDAAAAPGGIDDPTAQLLTRYSASRPLDPWPHQRMAARALALGDAAAAVVNLKFLDARADNDPTFALAIARSTRALKDAPTALVAAERAARIDPYDAATRELAAACAIEAGNLAAARDHILALTLIEPEREQHKRRLERIDALIAERVPAASSP
ncbi:MAG: hypothetical protein EXS17_03815 [Phycisphaerales bacterium]|nr:hypothetical protein [Phycisphaerales bacterium]